MNFVPSKNIPKLLYAALCRWAGTDDDDTLRPIYIAIMHHWMEVGGDPTGAEIAMRLADPALAARIRPLRVFTRPRRTDEKAEALARAVRV